MHGLPDVPLSVGYPSSTLKFLNGSPVFEFLRLNHIGHHVASGRSNYNVCCPGMDHVVGKLSLQFLKSLWWSKPFHQWGLFFWIIMITLLLSPSIFTSTTSYKLLKITKERCEITVLVALELLLLLLLKVVCSLIIYWAYVTLLSLSICILDLIESDMFYTMYSCTKWNLVDV